MSKEDLHYLGHRQRLRDRFLKTGLDGFADYEVVELLLTLAIPRSDVKQTAKALIARFGNLRGILDAEVEELRAIPGIGTVTPVALKITRERQGGGRLCVCTDPDKERVMSTVFIGGSRRIGRLNEVIRARLDDIVDRGLRVVIGDANGSDRAVQAYLAGKGHRDVVVYCMAGACRNNLGGWEIQEVEANGERGFDYYALKDAQMARKADCGFMLWDGKSKGTFLNMQRLLEVRKPVVIYFAPDRQCVTIRQPEEVKTLLARCQPGDRRRLSLLLAEPGDKEALLPLDEGALAGSRVRTARGSARI
jgi:hypothetical protein